VLAMGPGRRAGGTVAFGPYVMRLARLGGGPGRPLVFGLNCGMTRTLAMAAFMTIPSAFNLLHIGDIMAGTTLLQPGHDGAQSDMKGVW
jgi:hypothetical protein